MALTLLTIALVARARDGTVVLSVIDWSGSPRGKTWGLCYDKKETAVEPREANRRKLGVFRNPDQRFSLCVAGRHPIHDPVETGSAF